MPEKKLYDLTVDPEFRDLIPPLNEEELKLLVKRNGTTSVTSISTDNDGPSEYYNLNGQRITAPADKRQLYIERRNGKATVRVRR